MALPQPAPLHALKIDQRPRKSWTQFTLGILFFVAFISSLVMIHLTQVFFLLPLKLVPGEWARKAYDDGVRETKGAIGKLTVLITQVFAPTEFRITFETEGAGKFASKEIEKIAVRDKKTNEVIGIDLPNKIIFIANHQIYADWWYFWSFTYFLNIHKDVVIVLKKSLKWLPLVGWGMQIFRFIFLARSWVSDRLVMASQVAKLGRRSELYDTPISFIIYPEGTLVSEQTRPVSKKFADKMDIDDMTHTLLPRSTGLQFCLRSLLPKVPSLKLLDMTVVYPGIPPLGYGQDYYTLRSIFMDGIAPPVIHIHLRIFDVASEVPIGDLSSASAIKLPKPSNPNGANGHSNPQIQMNGQAIPLPSPLLSSKTYAVDPASVEVDVPESEKEEFELWLRDIWRSKDDKIEEFHREGKFVSKGAEALKVPVRLRSNAEVLDAYCFFGPAVIGYLARRFF